MTVASAPLSSLGISALAAAIDHRSIGRGKKRWTAQVVGVHASPQEVWVQVARRSRQSAAPSSLVLRLSPRATTAHALAALENAGSPASYPHVINVMRAV